MTELELPVEENMLAPNATGGYLISFSQLSSWARCQMQAHYNLRARRDPEAPQPEYLSATVYGSVMHHSLHMLERLHHEGRDDALEVAQRTFRYYWHPANLHQLDLKITAWVPRTTWAGLNDRGPLALREYYALLVKSDARLLGLEYEFAVPVEVRGRVHTLRGFVDRLEIDRASRKPYISLADFKTGKQPTWLRYNQQGSLYAYVSTRPEFWKGWPESGLPEFPVFPPEDLERIEHSLLAHKYRLHVGQDEDFPLAARRFRWVNMQEVKFVDGGWRNERDYARLKLMIDAYVRASEAGIYSLSPSGDVCHYCAFRGVCGGVGLPNEDEGAPT